MPRQVEVQHERAGSVEPAEGDLTMRLSSEERAPLSQAMAELNQGDSRRFCDAMWLGFGDKWRVLLADLASGGYVAIQDQECNEGIRITERGRALAATLIHAIRQSA
jgi:hypothetical protein